MKEQNIDPPMEELVRQTQESYQRIRSILDDAKNKLYGTGRKKEEASSGNSSNSNDSSV